MIKILDIRKAYGSTIAVDGLSLSIGRGEVFGLLGPNGAGKTTTISMMIGLTRPDSGTIELEGLGAPSHPAARQVIGVAPQSLALYESLTAHENIVFFAKLFGLRGTLLASRTTAALEAVGLESRCNDRVRTFSGGMKRRLNLAAALVHDPTIVLLDEPTAGVDPQSRNNIIDVVLRLKQQGRTVVYTTHYMEEAQRVCDRVAVMDRGKLLALGTVDELIDRHGGDSTVMYERRGEHAVVERIRTPDPLSELARVLAMPDRGGVTGVRVDRPNLESVFLNLTGRTLRDE